MAKTIQIDGKKLAAERIARRLSQGELATAVGKTESWLSKLEVNRNGKGVFLKTFVKLAEALKISADDLELKVSVHQATKDFHVNVDPYSEQKFSEIPLFDLSLAAGPWSDVTDVHDMCGPDSIKQGIFRVRISGDSMQPKYKNGTIVEFQCLRWGEDPIVIGSDYYLQKDDGTATFKRVVSATDEELTLRALNKKKYPEPMIVERSMIVRMALAVYQVIRIEPP